MKRITAASACAGMIATSLALAPAALAAPKGPAIVHQDSGVRPASAGELTVSFTLAKSAAQKRLTASLATGRVHQRRSAAFAQTAPAAVHRDAVLAWAKANGFRVLHASRFLVSVAGPARALATDLGTSLRSAHGYTLATSPLVVPAELAAHVSSAVGLDNRPVFKRHSRDFGPADVREMSNNPVRSSSAGAGVTVGTVNFSGWTSSDLTQWASDPDADPNTSDAISVAPGQITEVPIGGFNTVGTGLDPAEGEVDLDAQAILGAAPGAKQRLYFGENSDAGALAIWDQMVQDAGQGLLQVASTSWGGCEPDLGSSVAAESQAIENLVAAGVTVFAASGDDGANDCGDSRVTVDFPASDPLVVAVGGTTTSSSAPGSPYQQCAWGPGACQFDLDPNELNGSSGGGVSGVFSKPSWQPGSASGRQVPDIAALADPRTGYIGYLTTDWDSTNSPYGAYTLFGGTSLAAPLSAAGLASVIGSISPVAGLGNILPTLYGTPSATHDVNGNGNGVYSATTGYDQVTGLGTVDWTAFKSALVVGDPSVAVSPYTRSTTVPITVTGALSSYTSWGVAEGTTGDCAANSQSTAPTAATISAGDGTHAFTVTALDNKSVCHKVTRSVVLDTGVPAITGAKATSIGTTTPRFSLSWTPSDTGSGIAYTRVTVRDSTANKDVYSGYPGGGTVTLPTATAGHAYAATLTAYDRAGNASPASVAAFRAATDDKAFAFSGFTRAANGADYMGSHAVASRAGSYARFTFTGKQAWVGVVKSRSNGYMDVYVDGVRKARLSLYSSTTRFRQQLRIASFAASGTHTVVLKATGAHQSGATGSNINVDSLTFV